MTATIRTTRWWNRKSQFFKTRSQKTTRCSRHLDPSFLKDFGLWCSSISSKISQKMQVSKGLLCFIQHPSKISISPCSTKPTISWNRGLSTSLPTSLCWWRLPAATTAAASGIWRRQQLGKRKNARGHGEVSSNDTWPISVCVYIGVFMFMYKCWFGEMLLNVG